VGLAGGRDQLAVKHPVAHPGAVRAQVQTHLCQALHVEGTAGLCGIAAVLREADFNLVASRHRGLVRAVAVRGSAVFLLLAFQNPHDRSYCVPISRRGWHTEQFVDLAEIADCFHVTTVLSEDESAFQRD
jgi:hypothetical protein